MQNLNVFVFEIIDTFDSRIELELRNLPRLAAQLLPRLIQMIQVQVRISERMDEFADIEIAHLRDHVCQECVGCDVEWHTEEDISAALIQLTTQRRSSTCGRGSDVKLKQQMTRRQCHFRKIGDVPRADDQTTRVRVRLDLLNDLCDLIVDCAIRTFPSPPLLAVDRPEVALWIRPFVPDRHLIVMEISDVRVAFQEPQKFVEDRARRELLRGNERETLGEMEPHLPAEDRERADTRPIVLSGAVGKDVLEKVEVLTHGKSSISA